MRMIWTGLAIAAGLGGAASAQAPAGPQRLQGVVSAVTDSSLTVTKSDGSSATVPLLPNRTTMIVGPTTLDQIQPGSYVATANRTQSDGSGVSTEIRVFPPDTARFDVNRVMDEGTQTMMTNGVVATAVSSDGGRKLTVDYGSGKRQIMVPPGIPILSNTVASPSIVKPGLKVTVSTTPGTADRPGRQTISVAKADLPR